MYAHRWHTVYPCTWNFDGYPSIINGYLWIIYGCPGLSRDMRGQGWVSKDYARVSLHTQEIPLVNVWIVYGYRWMIHDEFNDLLSYPSTNELIWGVIILFMYPFIHEVVDRSIYLKGYAKHKVWLKHFRFSTTSHHTNNITSNMDVLCKFSENDRMFFSKWEVSIYW